MKYIIALTGYKQCGKDTVANIIQKKIPKIQRIAFADALKNYVSKVTGFSIEEIEKLKVNNNFNFPVGKNVYNMRETLISFANSLREITDDGIWAKLSLEKINSDKILITDLRFLIEEKILKEFAQEHNYELIIVKIISDLDTCKKNDAEKEVDLINYNYKLFNEKNNIEKTENKINEFIMSYQLLN